MSLGDVKIVRTNNGLGKVDRTADMTCGLMTTGVAAGTLVLNTSYELKSLDDLESMGITASYDSTNDVLIHHHVSEFFRMNPGGVLWLRVASQATTMTALADEANTHAKQLLQDALGKVRILGISINPASGYTPTLTTGLNADVIGAIPKAQALATGEFDAHRPVQVILEGRNFNGTAASALDLRAQNAQEVSICIAQDPVVAALDALHAGYAAIGTILGTVSFAKVNENISWVQKFNAQDAINNKFVNPYLSSNLAVSSYTNASLDTLDTKGYIFLRTITGIAGAYFNDSHTCTLITSDYAYIEMNRTIHKAAILIRTALLPQLGGPVSVDSSTGKLANSFCKYMEKLGRQALDIMLQNQEIIDRSVYVDPNQNVQTTSKIIAKHKIVPYGTSRSIEGQVGFTNVI